MSNVYSRSGIGQPVPVTEQAQANQVVNSTGGFTFEVDDKTRLTRFLILGTSRGTYYADERKLTRDNVGFLIDLINRNEQLVIDMVTEISTSGRAFRNSQAIFAVAAIAVYGEKPHSSVKLTALLKAVCRTSTHLFEFAEYLELLGQNGWGRAKRTAVANWYTDKTVDSLTYQVVKYRQRNGWTHRDMLRLSHPEYLDQKVLNFVLGKIPVERMKFAGDFYKGLTVDSNGLPRAIEGFVVIQASATATDVVQALQTYPELPWEAIPTQFHNELAVWKQLLINGQLRGQALLRNITRLAKLGAFNDMMFAREYATLLTDESMIAQTRLHPFQYLLAGHVYANGSERSTKTWTSQSIISSALDDGFHRAFEFVEPTGKRTMVAIDVSASMTWMSSGIDGMMASELAAAMAVVIARSEPYHQIMGFANTFRDLGITSTSTINDARAKTTVATFGSTEIALPMSYAREQQIPVDTFVVITDNEVNQGGHPYQELKRYRKAMGINARLVVVACTPTPFTIADLSDAGMLDICGADANLPRLIADFSAGRI